MHIHKSAVEYKLPKQTNLTKMPTNSLRNEYEYYPFPQSSLKTLNNWFKNRNQKAYGICRKYFFFSKLAQQNSLKVSKDRQSIWTISSCNLITTALIENRVTTHKAFSIMTLRAHIITFHRQNSIQGCMKIKYNIQRLLNTTGLVSVIITLSLNTIHCTSCSTQVFFWFR